MDEKIIGVVLEAFVVICGIAVTQFFSEGTVVDTDPAFSGDKTTSPDRYKPWYFISYISALIVIVTLVLRFLVGSQTQLMAAYGPEAKEVSFHGFIADVSFLMFFGAFLVGAAQAKSVRAFMVWLALTSAAGVGWSVMALWRGESNLPLWWLEINFLQFVLTFLLSRWCKPLGAPAGDGKTAAHWGLVVAGAWFIVIFFFDLKKILGPYLGQNHPLAMFH
jgi:hypothetical protein